jgi:hypothetical protein
VHGRIDALVEPVQFVDQLEVERAQQPDYCVALRTRDMQWLEEEFVKLAVKQASIVERISEHESVAAKIGLTGQPAQHGSISRHTTASDEHSKAPTQSCGLLRVNEPKRP